MTNTDTDKLLSQFSELLADLHDPDDVAAFFQQFLSESEVQAITKRLEIVRLLSQNASYHDIQEELKVSSATVASAAAFLETDIAKKIMYHVSIARWADKWSQKLSSFISHS